MMLTLIGKTKTVATTSVAYVSTTVYLNIKHSTRLEWLA